MSTMVVKTVHHIIFVYTFIVHFFINETEKLLTQVSMEMTESVVTVDWENGFVEASAKDNVNVAKVFKELLVQAKVKYNLSPALRRKRRQSLPPPQHATGGNPAVPSAAQLAHLRSIQERHTGAGGKRNSCVIS